MGRRLISKPNPNDPNGICDAIARLDKRLNTSASPVFESIGLTGLTENALMYADGDGVLTSLAAATNGQLAIGNTGNPPSITGLTGTANQITVTNGAGSITLSTPQDIHAAATPTFAGLTLTGFTGILKASTGVVTSDAVHGDLADSVWATTADHDGRYYTEAEIAATSGAALVGWDNAASGYAASQVQAAIDEVIVAVTPVEYTGASISTETGTYDSGNLASTQIIDDADSYDVSEVTGVPGFEIRMTFTGVLTFNQIHTHTAYDGNPAHVVRIDLDKTPFNWSSFDTLLADIDDASGDFVFKMTDVPTPASYINSGTVRMRFYHATTGNATHDFRIDYAALWKTAAGGGVTEHGGLTGLSDDDHLQYHTDARAATWLAANHETTYTHADIASNTTHRGLSSGNPHSVTPTELSLVIGTNTQAWDAGLDSLAGLTYAAASFVKMTGANAFALRTIAETADDLEGTIDHANLSNLTIVAHDTTATGANLTSLTDGSETALHTHFVDRGDPASVDFATGDLTTDETFRDLDLSSIINDSGAKLVLMHLFIQDDAAGSRIMFRKKGNSNQLSRSNIRTQVADIPNDFDIIVACDTNQVVQYKATNVAFTFITITVKGWWL